MFMTVTLDYFKTDDLLVEFRKRIIQLQRILESHFFANFNTLVKR